MNKTRQNTCKLLNTGLVSLLVLYSLPTYAAIQFTEFKGLGFLPGDDRSEVLDVSADGNVLVGFSGGQAFRYTDTGGMVSLAKESSRAHAVSADGNTILVRTPNRTPNPTESFRYTISQGLVRLPIQAHALSADGNVIVGSRSSTASINGKLFDSREAVKYTETGGLVGLGYLPNGEGNLGNLRNRSISEDVSADGRVIVGVSTCNWVARKCEDEVFRYSHSDGMTGLGHLGENVLGRLSNFDPVISANGNVVVGRASFPGTITVAFRHTFSEGMIKLDDFPGVNFSESINLSRAVDVSSDGSLIVGLTVNEKGVFTDRIAGKKDREAVFWEAEENYAVKSLYDELKGDVRGVSEWSDLLVNAISDDGSTMVGTGFHNGHREAFVARLKVVPIPTALWLMGTAVFGLLGFRKSG